MIGSGVTLYEYDPAGYNAEGGGPVTSGTGLSCDFDRRNCCWANVPPPDDQLDWQLAVGQPDPAKIHRYFGPLGDATQVPPLPGDDVKMSS